MVIIPLVPTPSQKITVTLANQPCTIRVKQYSTGMFIDLYVNDAPIITGVICQEANLTVRDAYLGFSGDLVFFDVQPDPVLGAADPDYTGLGSRYVLSYFTQDELTALGISG